MGDPKRRPARYSGPRHPWEADRLAEEKILSKDFGLKNKKDIWKQNSVVKKIKDQIKKINTQVGKGVDQEKTALILKLIKYNLLLETQTLDDALELNIRDVMERRLQTQLVRQGLARTVKQARQFIVHGHVRVAGKKITSPSYLVTRDEQFKLEFLENSTLASEDHPERISSEKAPNAVDTKKSSTEKSVLDNLEDESAKEIGLKLEDSSAEDIDEASLIPKEDLE